MAVFGCGSPRRVSAGNFYACFFLPGRSQGRFKAFGCGSSICFWVFFAGSSFRWLSSGAVVLDVFLLAITTGLFFYLVGVKEGSRRLVVVLLFASGYSFPSFCSSLVFAGSSFRWRSSGAVVLDLFLAGNYYGSIFLPGRSQGRFKAFGCGSSICFWVFFSFFLFFYGFCW
jgi:hypothetical protein